MPVQSSFYVLEPILNISMYVPGPNPPKWINPDSAAYAVIKYLFDRMGGFGQSVRTDFAFDLNQLSKWVSAVFGPHIDHVSIQKMSVSDGDTTYDLKGERLSVLDDFSHCSLNYCTLGSDESDNFPSYISLGKIQTKYFERLSFRSCRHFIIAARTKEIVDKSKEKLEAIVEAEKAAFLTKQEQKTRIRVHEFPLAICGSDYI